MLFAAPLLALLAGAAAAPTTMTFAASADATVSQQTWDTPPQATENYGLRPDLQTERGGRTGFLLRFDLPAATVPPNSAVLQASLRLHGLLDASATPRVQSVFAVRAAWHEGNQQDSPIDAAGKFGVTGTNAFDFFDGEGTDVAWSAVGLAAPDDRDEDPLGEFSVGPAQEYAVDVTGVVQQWVRGEAPNFGLYVTDLGGYDPNDAFFNRAFASREAAAAETRPTLVIEFDPDTPSADAGEDVRELFWDGSPVILDATGSVDRPGGDDGSLEFRWTVVQAAFGASLAPGDEIVDFQSDATISLGSIEAGDWVFELEVRNSVGSTARDQVRMYLLRIPTAHPRLILTTAEIVRLRALAARETRAWTVLVGFSESTSTYFRNNIAVARALMGALLPETYPTHCESAAATALLMAGESMSYGPAIDLSMIFDWCYDAFSAPERATVTEAILGWLRTDYESPFSASFPSFSNYWPRYTAAFAFGALVTLGESGATDAERWLDEYRFERFGRHAVPMFDVIAAGGGWPEGDVYDGIANLLLMWGVEAFTSATGENLFESTAWFEERIPYFLMRSLPGIDEQYGFQYHPYIGTGDSERNRGPIVNYLRHIILIPSRRFPSHPRHAELQGYLAADEVGVSDDWLSVGEFLFFDPDLPTESPAMLAMHAAGTGEVFARSGWPDGASDGDRSVLHLAYTCGNHFSYHQHLSAGHLNIFKHDDLLVDAGVYSGDGLSYHDQNYEARTVAHNTLLVFNPDEDFVDFRSGTESNDGGQRSFRPGSRAPSVEAYLERADDVYETGEITGFLVHPLVTYIASDATRAYNSPLFNQATEAFQFLPDNVAKVAQFSREVSYLRGDLEFVVLVDRVAVTEARFSGPNTKLLFHHLVRPAVTAASSESVNAYTELFSGVGKVVVDLEGFDPTDKGTPRGRLSITPLAPATVNMRLVEGFWVDGVEYDWHWASDEPEPRPTTEFDPFPYGEWRLEMEPADNDLEHVFVTVLHPRASADARPEPPMERLAAVTGGAIAVWIGDADMNRVAVFSAALDLAPLAAGVEYSFVPTANDTTHVVHNLPPGARFALTVDEAGRQVALAPADDGDHQASPEGVVVFATSVVDGVQRIETPTASPEPDDGGDTGGPDVGDDDDDDDDDDDGSNINDNDDDDDDDSDGGDGGSDMTPAIVGGAIGGLIVVGGSAAIFTRMRRRRKDGGGDFHFELK